MTDTTEIEIQGIELPKEDPRIEALARQTLSQNRVAIFLVAYNAERHVGSVLKRIPEWVARQVTEVYVIDDHSKDHTVEAAKFAEWPEGYAPLRVYRTPYNQGYGGNQRLGYLYAIAQGFDIVVLLHADGQYAPEALPHILAPYAEGADAVFGSRFLNSGGAIKGGMPLYKFVGNRILTRIQNRLLGAQMSEMHSGYRSYRVSALKDVPFEFNSLDFDFDADIIVQMLGSGKRIVEVPIPTYYGDEICHVNGMQYAWNCVKTALKFRAMQLELFYDPKFDLRRSTHGPYTVKHAKTSLHHHVRSLELPTGTRVLDVGGGKGDAVGLAHAGKGAKVTVIDQVIGLVGGKAADAPSGGDASGVELVPSDLNRSWRDSLPLDRTFDVVFALDVLEHLVSPERGAREIFERMERGGKLYVSTGNVAFLPLRIMLAFGQFNYGRRGILDLTHTRLFTLNTFTRLLRNAGFRVDRVVGFGPPIADLSGEIRKVSKLAEFIDRVATFFARRWPRLFAFQILLECTRTDSPRDLMRRTFEGDVGRDVTRSRTNIYSLAE